MTCLVLIPHELFHGPILRWSGPGANQNTTLLNKSPHILIFDRIHTSYAGVYKCLISFSIPEAGINLTGMGMTEVNIQSKNNNNILTHIEFIYIILSLVPPPILTITGSPRDADFFQGLDLTFTCSAELQSTVDTPVTLMATWMRNDTKLVEDDGYMTVTNVTVAALPHTYLTTVRLNPIDFDDAGTYTCIVTVSADNTTFINGTTVSAMRTVTIISGTICE